MDASADDPGTAQRGRPRDAAARTAVLHAADDLLVELGYEALTMKAIAERARVSRQTVYRWWTSKAEILFEACAIDAARELAVDETLDPVTALARFIERLTVFVTGSDAGATYLALVGAAQVDASVAALLLPADPLRREAATVVARVRVASGSAPDLDTAVSQLVGPPVFIRLGGTALPSDFADAHLAFLAAAWSLPVSR